ncbi:MAG: ATP-binding protein [Pseudomonadota bacterium]
MTSAETDKSTEEIQRLQKRLRRLAEEKSNLQLIMRLIEQINPLPGIEEMVHTMLLSMVDTIGGTNIKLYYFVEAELRYVDFMGETRILPDFDDPLVAQVATSSAFIEQRGDTDNALLLDAAVEGSWTWGFPLLVGKELIGVIKLENLHISGASLRTFLPVFFSHAALILSNEIRAESRRKIEAELAESEASLKVLIEHTPIAMLVDVGVDADEHVEMMNQQFTTLFGYSMEDVPNVRQWWPLAYPDEKYREELKREWIRRVETAIQSQNDIEPMETTVICKDGTSRYVRISLASIGSRNIVTFEDLSSRKKAEDALSRYKDHLEEVVTERTAALADANQLLSQTQFAMDRAGIGIHWLDDDGHFIYVNEYAAQLLGYTQEQMRAMSVTDVDPNFAGKDFKVQTQPLREIRTSTFETAQRHKNGEVIPLEVTFYYQPGKEESSGRFISFVTDIRQRKQAEQTLRRAMEAAETANRAKSTFLTSMSHELRTPLNAILGFSSLMRRDEQLRPEQRTNLDIINRSGEHLLTLINDILELAKIEAGKTQLNITPFDLGVLVRDVTDMMELRARAKGLRLLIDQSSQFPRYINGDEARLRQILINLLGNAVKFTQQGGVTLRLGTKQNAIAHLIIEIEDTGPGLSAEDQQRLFQPFMQFGKQPGDNKGTGLGLSITRQFVQLMGGNISVESTVGKGSLFRVELPLSEVKEADLLPQHETEKGEVVGLASGQPVYRILIVEDQLENQLLLSQLMQRIGFEIQVAENGAQGVQLFQSWQPHLIFMDRRMPDMDGIAATQAIRQLPGGKEVKIVAVTASAFMEQRDEMMAAGMNDFVRKPYRFNEIYDSLTRQLGLKFVYAEAETGTAPPVALTAEMLAVLPEALRSELKEALMSLDSDPINEAISKVASIDQKLFRTLTKLVNDFDYPTILKVLEDD